MKPIYLTVIEHNTAAICTAWHIDHWKCFTMVSTSPFTHTFTHHIHTLWVSRLKVHVVHRPIVLLTSLYFIYLMKWISTNFLGWTNSSLAFSSLKCNITENHQALSVCQAWGSVIKQIIHAPYEEPQTAQCRGRGWTGSRRRLPVAFNTLPALENTLQGDALLTDAKWQL